MRKAENGEARRNSRAGSAIGGLFAVALMLGGGCAAPQPTTKEKLAEAYGQLESPNPDYAGMSAAADAYLKEQPEGPAAADALYLHGRALEEKAQRDAAGAQRGLGGGDKYYSPARTKNPRPQLEALIHVGMGNVLYFQDRYAAAINELASGYAKLERAEDKAWALYRIGLCHQRMGNWEEADRNFAMVQEQFSNTLQA